MTVNLNGKFTKRDLLSLPSAKWDDPGWWDSLLIVPTPRKHESGFAHIAIIGVVEVGRTSEATKILAWPDDIQWPAQSGLSGLVDYGGLHTDAYHPSGVLRLWSREYEFSTTAALSSVTILIRPRNRR